MAHITQHAVARMIAEATLDVFSTMLNLEITPGEPYVGAQSQVTRSGVTSFVGLAGSWVGTGAIDCSAEFACQISSHFLMSDYAAVNEEVLDAVAEVTNMIIGNVKTKLEEIVGPLGLSIPTVIYGRNFASRVVGTPEWVIVPFDCSGQRMEVQMCLAPAERAHLLRTPAAQPISV